MIKGQFNHSPKVAGMAGPSEISVLRACVLPLVSRRGGTGGAPKHRALLYAKSAEVCVSYCALIKEARIPDERNKPAIQYIFYVKLNVLQEVVRVGQGYINI